MIDGTMHSPIIARHADRGFAIIDRGGPACDIVRDRSHGDASIFIDEVLVCTPEYTLRRMGDPLPDGHLEGLLATWIDTHGWYYATPGDARITDHRGIVLLDEGDSRATTCLVCSKSWDDTVPTGWTPAPAGRCPWESEHDAVCPECGDERDLDHEHDGRRVCERCCGVCADEREAVAWDTERATKVAESATWDACHRCGERIDPASAVHVRGGFSSATPAGRPMCVDCAEQISST